jgi:hypothetical protein
MKYLGEPEIVEPTNQKHDVPYIMKSRRRDELSRIKFLPSIPIDSVTRSRGKPSDNRIGFNSPIGRVNARTVSIPVMRIPSKLEILFHRLIKTSTAADMPGKMIQITDVLIMF